jgi:hypothetical protein
LRYGFTEHHAWLWRLLFRILSQGELAVGEGMLEQSLRRTETDSGSSAGELLRECLPDKRQGKAGLAKLGREIVARCDPTHDVERTLPYGPDSAGACERFEPFQCFA